jgi:hypothetical protein
MPAVVVVVVVVVVVTTSETSNSQCNNIRSPEDKSRANSEILMLKINIQLFFYFK